MAEQKAVCGGFLVGEGLKMEGKVLSAIGGASEGRTVKVYPIEISTDGVVTGITHEQILDDYRSNNIYPLLLNITKDKLFQPTMIDVTNGEGYNYIQFDCIEGNRTYFENIYIDDYDVEYNPAKYSILRLQVEYKNGQYKPLAEPKTAQDQWMYTYASNAEIHLYVQSPSVNKYEKYTMTHAINTKIVYQNTMINDDGKLVIRQLVVTDADTYAYSEKTID